MVFVHGLRGDAFGTWRHGSDASTSWPHWLGEDFPQVGVWSLGYAASPTRWARVHGWFSSRHRDAGHAMKLPDRAGQVLDLMVQRGLGERPLMLVGHSLGGLLIKQILRKAVDAPEPRRQAVARHTRAVLFLATPHAGAALATLAHAFRTAFRATVSIEDLRAHDAHLRDLLDWYRNHAEEFGIRTATYYEQRDIKGVLPIVNPTSSHPGVGSDPVPLDEDHLSIAKPRFRDAQVYCAACGLVRDSLLAAAPASNALLTASHSDDGPSHEITIRLDPAGRSTAPRVPHQLPPAAEHFVGRRTEVEQLASRLRAHRNTAVVGPAGLGKTALAAEAVRAVVGDSPAELAASPYPDGVVYLDLYTSHGQAEPVWSTLANTLAGAGLLPRSDARTRATEACRGQRVLVIVEGAEEADGTSGRASVQELLGVLSPENRRLLLTRRSDQAVPAETITLRRVLQPPDAARLLDALTEGSLPAAIRGRVLALLEGHPLGLTWAGNLLARGDDDPERLIADWNADQLPSLSDPIEAAHTLEWLFTRSVRGVSEPAHRALAVAGLLARAPVPLAAFEAALEPGGTEQTEAVRDALRTLVRRGLLRLSDEADHWEFTHALGYRFARQRAGADAGLRLQLAAWLRKHMETPLAAATDVDREAAVITASLEHATALLRTDADQQLWSPLASFLTYEVRDRLRQVGRLGLEKLALDAATGWFETIPVPTSEQPTWLRERSVVLNGIGDVLRDQGKLDQALAFYAQALAIARRLADADPADAGWQRDLCVSLNNVGDVLRDQGKLDDALAAYSESLEIRRRLASADPANAGWQRDLSFVLTCLAELHDRMGEHSVALKFAAESLAIDEPLAALDPTNATWRQGVAITRALVQRLRG